MSTGGSSGNSNGGGSNGFSNSNNLAGISEDPNSANNDLKPVSIFSTDYKKYVYNLFSSLKTSSNFLSISIHDFEF
jgi:hypothetical protein